MPVKPNLQPLSAEHIRYGTGEVLSVHTLDIGILAAVVRFLDGTERCIRLDQHYWLTPIADLAPTPPKPPKRMRKKRAPQTAELEAA